MDPAARVRTESLIGPEAMRRLACARVLLFGLGGVGSWCVEALARAGIGSLGLVDFDVFSPSNLNRQLGALVSTLGRHKVDVARERILDIAPDCLVRTYPLRWTAETADAPDAPVLSEWDVVIDAIDLVSAKIALAERCTEVGVPLFVALGGGNKLDPSRFEITDLSKTDRCPLAKVLRKKLRKRGIVHMPVVASTEEPRRPIALPPTPNEPAASARVPTTGSLPTVVGEEGLLLAHAVLTHLMGPVASRLRCDKRS